MPSYPVTTIEKLEGRINAVNTGELSKNLYQTLVSTTTQLREILMLGSLDQATGVVEDFYMPEHQQINEKRFIYFRLNNGFVDQSVNALKLEFAFTFDDLNGGDASEIPAQYLQIDEEKGYVTMDTIQFDTDLFSVYNTTRRTNFFREYLFRITYDQPREMGGLPMKPGPEVVEFTLSGSVRLRHRPSAFATSSCTLI